MKVKFKDVICMGNQTYTAGEVGEFTEITGQQLIDKGYVEAVAEKKADDDAKAKAAAEKAEKEAAAKAEKEAKAKEAAANTKK